MYYKYCQRCRKSTNGEYLCNDCKEEIEIVYRKEFKYEDRGLKKNCYEKANDPPTNKSFTTDQNNSSQETNKNEYSFFSVLEEMKDAFMQGWNLQEYKPKNIEEAKNKNKYSIFNFLKELKDAFMEGWNEGLQEYKEKNIEEEKNNKINEKKQGNYQTTNKQRKYKTAKGFYVRSQQERTISDFLTENGIFHIYEKRFPINQEEYLLPDFYIKGPVMFHGKILRDVYIEHWGRENDEEYNKRKEYKIPIYRQAGITLINTYPEDIIDYKSSLTRKLKNYKENQVNY